MIRVQAEAFDPSAEMAAFGNGRTDIGAVASFTGLVRDTHHGRKINALTLEHYPGMTEQELARIEAQAIERWPLDDCLVIHRYGRMLPGEPIVLVMTASAHRGAALEACAFLMDWLKTQAPFWKMEETDEGELWVEARSSDDDAAARWR